MSAVDQILGQSTIATYTPEKLTQAIQAEMSQRKPSDISGMTDLLQSIVPVGSLRLSPASAAEPGWALADGALVSKINYPVLDKLMAARSYPEGESPDAFGVPLVPSTVPYLAWQVKLG